MNRHPNRAKANALAGAACLKWASPFFLPATRLRWATCRPSLGVPTLAGHTLVAYSSDRTRMDLTFVSQTPKLGARLHDDIRP